MSTPDTPPQREGSELIERLRAHAASSDTSHATADALHIEAASRLQALEAENERLRGAVSSAERRVRPSARTDALSPAGWEPIASAPRDGQHFLACRAGSSFGWMNGAELPPIQTVVHWFPDPEQPGFYTSVNELEPQHPFDATHWKPLDAPAREATQ